MKTSLAIAFFFLLVFFVMILVAVNCEPKPSGAQAIGLALEWTLHLLGGIIAVVSAFGMLFIAAVHGSFQRQMVLAVPLLAGLLLIGANWGLAVALGAVVTIWIFRFGAPEIERAAGAKTTASQPPA